MSTALQSSMLVPHLVRERLRAIMAEQRSAPLAAFWKHHPVADQSAGGLVEATLAFQQATGSDIVKLSPAGNYQVAQRGLVEGWCGDALGRRTISGRAILNAEDWLRLAHGISPLELEIVEAAGQLRRRLGPAPVLLASVFSPLTQALMLAGAETLQRHLLQAPLAVQAGLQVLTDCTVSLIKRYRAAGVDGIYLAAQHCTESLLPRALYREFGPTSERQVYDACSGLFCSILHLHGANIHVDCLPLQGAWLLHYEWDSSNPAPECVRSLSPWPLMPGLPCSLWQEGTALARIQQRLDLCRQPSALLGAACVVPLAIAESEIASWVREVHAYT